MVTSQLYYFAYPVACLFLIILSKRINGVGQKYFLIGLGFNLLLLFLAAIGSSAISDNVYVIIAVIATVSAGLVSTPSAGAGFGAGNGIASLVDLLMTYYFYAPTLYYNVYTEILLIFFHTLFWIALGYLPAAARIGRSTAMAIVRGFAGIFLVWLLTLPPYLLGLTAWASLGNEFLWLTGVLTTIVMNIYLHFFPRPAAPVHAAQKTLIGRRMEKASSCMKEAARLEDTGRLAEAALKYNEATNLFRKLSKPREAAECSQNGMRAAERHTIFRFLQGEVIESKQVIKLVSEEVAHAIAESDQSSLMKRFLAFPEGHGFMDYIQAHGSVQIGQLSEEHSLEDKVTLGLIEIAVKEELLHGWFADNRQAFVTTRKVQQELDRHLLGSMSSLY